LPNNIATESACNPIRGLPSTPVAIQMHWRIHGVITGQIPVCGDFHYQP